jgi:exo-beta-1,3-glucanase (GH17 family)
MACAMANAAPVCRHEVQIDAIREALAHTRFVSYQPTALRIIDGKATHANEASIADDLTVLRSRFDGLITYGASSGAERVPDVAAALGYKAVIVGVWDPSSDEEVGKAIAAWGRHPQLVVGISLGNETVLGKRFDFESLGGAIGEVRKKAPGLVLSTTEPFHLFLTEAATPLLHELDFMLANVHPVFQPWFASASDETAAQFVVNVVDLLAAAYCGPILVKETGVPTAPDRAGYSETRQATFYRELRDRFPPTAARAFAYFSAFDAPWRVADSHPVPGYHPEEAHWGLFDDARRPKPVVSVIPPLHGQR